MKITSQIPGLRIDLRQSGGEMRHVQVFKCSTCGAEDEICNNKGRPYPVNVVARMMKNKGWDPEVKRGRHTCPTCKVKAKKPAAEKEIEQMSNQPKSPTPADNRKIFRAIEDVYDEARARYTEGNTDNSIALMLKVPRKWVENIREMNFGPSGENEHMGVLAANLGDLYHRAETHKLEALEAASKGEKAALALEEIQTEIRTMQKRLDSIQQAVGPYVVKHN